MGVYRWDAKSEQLLNDVTDSAVLRDRLPRLNDFYEGIESMRQVQDEISVLGSFTKRTGFTPGKNFQRIATIPYSVAAAMVEIDPEIFKDRGRFYRWLGQHPEYDTRSSIR